MVIPSLVVTGTPGELTGFLHFRFDRSILSHQLVLPGFQDGLDAFKTGRGSVREGFPAGTLQPLGRIAICQFQQCHTGLVTLLLYLVGREEYPHNSSSVLADLFCPADETLAIPLQVDLVVRRHMAIHHAVLVGTAMET